MPRPLSQKGFTVIELVVVAAIVGVLAAIGVTNYVKYSNRTKQRTGKIHLAGAYLAQRTFFAEHLSFTYCLRQIGGLPGGDPDRTGTLVAGVTRPYFIGFMNGNAVNNCGPQANQSCYLSQYVPPSPTLCDCAAFPARGSNDCTADSTSISVIADANAYTWNTNRTVFKIGMVARFGNPLADVWEMDENKVITNLQNGE